MNVVLRQLQRVQIMNVALYRGEKDAAGKHCNVSGQGIVSAHRGPDARAHLLNVHDG